MVQASNLPLSNNYSKMDLPGRLRETCVSNAGLTATAIVSSGKSTAAVRSGGMEHKAYGHIRDLIYQESGEES